ncbi:MAG TPA: hypothetical protein VMK13_12570 [Streptosporangiaceae bacterium]|nr:hypothetical protein [Streptosporangiaceae bacterium]
MAIIEIIADPGTRLHLGGPGLAALRECFFPGDCQSCNRPLGGRPPALSVSVLSPGHAMARLYHPACVPPQWNDSGLIEVAPGPGTVSRSARCWLFPAAGAPGPVYLPALLVNPGFESVFLREGPDGWRPVLPEWFSAAGMLPGAAGSPLPGVRSAIDGGIASVVFPASPNPYSAPAEPVTLARARELGGFLILVSQVVDPAALSPASATPVLQRAFSAGQIISGWASLDS